MALLGDELRARLALSYSVPQDRTTLQIISPWVIRAANRDKLLFGSDNSPRNFHSRNGRSGKRVETSLLEKLNRRFAIWQKIQLNPFASCKIASMAILLDLLCF